MAHSLDYSTVYSDNCLTYEVILLQHTTEQILPRLSSIKGTLFLAYNFIGSFGDPKWMSLGFDLKKCYEGKTYLPPLPSFLATDLITPTATVWRMSRTAKRPSGG